MTGVELALFDVMALNALGWSTWGHGPLAALLVWLVGGGSLVWLTANELRHAALLERLRELEEHGAALEEQRLSLARLAKVARLG